jgi:hypothetical protein
MCAALERSFQSRPVSFLVRRNFVRTFDRLSTTALTSCQDGNARGVWTLAVHDQAPADVGAIRSFGLELSLRPGIQPVAAARRGARLAAA